MNYLIIICLFIFDINVVVFKFIVLKILMVNFNVKIYFG